MEFNARKGNFHWPDIMAGQLVRLRCPFSFKNPVYTERTCTVNVQGEVVWTESRDLNICPDPPLAEAVKRLSNQVRSDVYDTQNPKLSIL